MNEWIKIANSQVGIEEVPRGSNAGKDVEKYLASVGLGKGYAWCMAFVYWCVLQASVLKGFKNPLKRTGGVKDQLNNSKSMVVKSPEAGDIFIIIYSNGISGHTGFVSKVLDKGMVETIEGNTNADGSREGYKVLKRTRSTKSITAFLRIKV